MTHDKCIGPDEGGWALYISVQSEIYIGRDDPDERTYLIPVNAEMKALMHQVAQASASTVGIIEQLEHAVQNDKSLEAVPDETPLEEDVIMLKPGSDAIIGAGPEVVAFRNHAGIPYLILDNICILLDESHTKNDFARLDPHAFARIEAVAKNGRHPCFTVKQNKVRFEINFYSSSPPDTHNKS